MEIKEKRKKIFEEVPVTEAVARLAVPTVCSQIIMVLYNMADTYFIGWSHSDAMITAVTMCMPAMMFLTAIANLFGIGGSGVISRALGEGHSKIARRACGLAFWSCVVVTFIYCLCAFVLMDTYIRALGCRDDNVLAFGRTYLLWVLVAGGIPTSSSTLFSHLSRSDGRAVQSSACIMAGGVLNIVLDPLFMFVILPEGREVQGAAIATCISNIIVFVFFLFLIFREKKRSIMRLKIPDSMTIRNFLPDILLTGIPACVMTLFENISYAVLFNLMSAAGVASQAGLGVSKKINMLAHSMVRGMAQGVLPLIAYNFAKGNRERMQGTLTETLKISTFLAGACFAVNTYFARRLIGIFIQSGPSFENGVQFLRILSLGAPFSACAYVAISYFEAVKEGKRSLALALLRKGAVDIPLMVALRYAISPKSAVWSTPLTDFVCCAIAIVMLRRYSVRLAGRAV